MLGLEAQLVLAASSDAASAVRAGARCVRRVPNTHGDFTAAWAGFHVAVAVPDDSGAACNTWQQHAYRSARLLVVLDTDTAPDPGVALLCTGEAHDTDAWLARVRAQVPAMQSASILAVDMEQVARAWNIPLLACAGPNCVDAVAQVLQACPLPLASPSSPSSLLRDLLSVCLTLPPAMPVPLQVCSQICGVSQHQLARALTRLACAGMLDARDNTDTEGCAWHVQALVARVTSSDRATWHARMHDACVASSTGEGYAVACGAWHAIHAGRVDAAVRAVFSLPWLTSVLARPGDQPRLLHAMLALLAPLAPDAWQLERVASYAHECNASTRNDIAMLVQACVSSTQLHATALLRECEAELHLRVLRTPTRARYLLRCLPGYRPALAGGMPLVHIRGTVLALSRDALRTQQWHMYDVVRARYDARMQFPPSLPRLEVVCLARSSGASQHVELVASTLTNVFQQMLVVPLDERAPGMERMRIGATEYVIELLVVPASAARACTLVAAALQSGDVWLWDLAHRRLHVVLAGHTEAALALAASGPNHLVSASLDRTLRVWDLRTYTCCGVLAGHTSGVTGAAAHDDTLLSVCGSSEPVRVWCVSAATQLGTLATLAAWADVFPHSNGTLYALTGASNSPTRLWDLATFACVREFSLQASLARHVLLHGDLRVIVQPKHGHGTVLLLDPMQATRQAPARFVACVAKHVVRHRDHDWLLVSESDGTLALQRLLEEEEEEEEEEGEDMSGGLNRVELAQPGVAAFLTHTQDLDASLLVGVVLDHKRSFHVYDVAQRALKWSLNIRLESLDQSLCLMQDRIVVSQASHTPLRMFDLKGSADAGTLPFQSGSGPRALDAWGTTLVCSTGSEVDVYDVLQQQQIASFTCPENVCELAIMMTHHETMLVVVATSSVVYAWDTRQGVLRILGACVHARHLAFASDQIVLAASSCRLQAWHLFTGASVLDVCLPDRICGLAGSGSGRVAVLFPGGHVDHYQMLSTTNLSL